MMRDDIPARKPRAIPAGRAARLGQFGRLAGSVAGGVIAEGARRLAEGRRPRLSDLLLTPANAARVAERLSNLRGAAMKLGQMISMDAGDLLPAELAAVMARLRDDAHHMPPRQLQKVLEAEWGADWRARFDRFDASPLAAASIGQVHRAVTRDGRDLAIKVQYPGVRDSISADVDNVASLLRISNLLPAELDIAPLLEEAKHQLGLEADYLREGAQMMRFRDLLGSDDNFLVPQLDKEFTTRSVLAMTYVEGKPIETLAEAPQPVRNRAMQNLIALVLKEIFEFGMMQTDPNFANYRVQNGTGRLVLLDFGATRTVSPATVQGYGDLMRAGLAADRGAVRRAAIAAGFLPEAAVSRHGGAVDRMIDVILGELHRPGPFDFGDRGFVSTLRDEGLVIAADRASWHLPPPDLLFVQRKVSGTALLAARLGARVDIREMSRSVVED